MLYRYTLYPSLYDLDAHQQVEEDWGGLVARFSRHLPVTRKDQSPGFGPYTLAPAARTCLKHKDERPRTWAHRCDECVTAMTLAVFDVDVGTPEQVAECDELLERGKVARIWYSSYSYSPARPKPPLRLVLPLSHPVSPSNWASFRRNLARKYAVPCDLTQCAGKSHFYYQPSCPPGATKVVEVVAGRPVDVLAIPQVAELPTRAVNVELWRPPADPPPGTPVDLKPLKEALARRARSLVHGGPKEKMKAEVLQHLVRGEPLAEKGKRNDMTLLAAGMVAYTLPGTPLSVFLALFRPSFEAMVAAGSSLQEAELERMLLTAMRAKADADARDNEIQASLDARLAAKKHELRRGV